MKKLGRLILAHREGTIEQLRDFYLEQGRTEFLVIAYNRETVDPRKFQESENFHFIPYRAFDGQVSIFGDRHRVWIDAVKKFPDIDSWIVHDDDFICRPHDEDIFSHVGPNEYGMIGKAFPVWQEGMKKEGEDFDTYPFPQAQRFWGRFTTAPTDEEVENALLAAYPFDFHGIKTILAGYSDFIAASREDILKLEEPRFATVYGAIERLPHTLWHAKGVSPVDMRQYYKVKVLMDVVYIPMNENYDMLHPVKFWRGTSPDFPARIKNLEYTTKTLVKKIIKHRGWRW